MIVGVAKTVMVVLYWIMDKWTRSCLRDRCELTRAGKGIVRIRMIDDLIVLRIYNILGGDVRWRLICVLMVRWGEGL